MALSVPTYSVQVSFTDPFDTPDWVDITRWVKKGSTKRGRQHELQRAIAGTCALTITNQDGRFSTFNTTSPYVNMMTAQDSYFAVPPTGLAGAGLPGLGTWGLNTNPVNATAAFVGNQGYDGRGAMSLASAAAGTMTITTANFTSSGSYPVTAGVTYGFQAQFKTAVSARACSVGVLWYNASDVQIGATVYGSTVTDATSVYSKATLSAVAPALATHCAVAVRVAATGAANEVHYVTRIMLSTGDASGNVSTAWAPGGRGLVPARPVKVSATSGSVYPVFYGYIDAWLPSYGTILSDQVINASDGLTLLALPYITTSGYVGQVLADGAAGFWYMGDAVGSQTAADSTPNQGYLAVAANSGGTATFGAPGLLYGDTHTAVTLNAGPAAVGGVIESGGFTVSEANGITLECVMSSTTLNNIGSSAGTTYFVGLLSGNASITATIGGVGTASFNVTGGTTITSGSVNDGLPHHLALTWAKTTGHYVAYVDGVAVNSGTATAPGATVGSALTGASSSGGGGGNFNFTIAGMAITPTALSAAQIAVHSTLSKHGFVQQQSGQRVGAILTALGVPASLQSLATGISAVQQPTSTLTTTPALSHIQTVEATEQGFGYVDESGIFTYRDRHYILQNAAATVSNGTFANDTNNAHFKFLVGSIIPAEDALDWWTDTPVSAIANAPIGVTGAIQNTPNPDGRRMGGVRTLTGYSSMLQTTDTEAATLSQWLKAHYGLPIARVRQMKLDSTATNPSSIPQMLGRKLLDRITVIWQPLDGTNSPFSQDSLIENIQHDFGPDLWTTTWGLSVAETQKYLVLNDPVLGKLDSNRLGY